MNVVTAASEMRKVASEIACNSAMGLRRALDGAGGDPSRDPVGVATALLPLVSRRGALYDAGLERTTSLFKESRIIYFDPAVTLYLSLANKGEREPLHNHGIWNILMPCSGSMHFRACQRLDDQSQPGIADLAVVHDRVLGPGDAGIVGTPPHDIHEFDILEDETWFITAAQGPGAAIRQFYDLNTGSYTERALY